MASRPLFDFGNDSNLKGWIKAMPNNKTASAPARDSSEWNNAWATVCRLASARQVALQEISPDHPATSFSYPMTETVNAVDTAPRSANQTFTIDQGQLDRAIAEIEEACAVLKSAEPALEAWRPDAAPPSVPRKQRSVWLLIGTIWLSIVLVVAGVIAVIGYFLA